MSWTLKERRIYIRQTKITTLSSKSAISLKFIAGFLAYGTLPSAFPAG
jgi:hypothetical protein